MNNNPIKKPKPKSTQAEKDAVMQIAVKVETGFNCNWRNIEPLQPEGFKGQTANEKETLKNSIVKNGFHDAFDVWQHEGRLLSIDGVHRKIALLELAEEGYEIPEQLPCTYVTAENETEAATIILSRNSQHSHILSAAVMTAAFKIPAATIEAVVPQKNLEAWNETEQDNAIQLTAEEDDFEFEDGGIETDIVIGDLFEIGVHRLLCGDSTDSDQVAKLMNGEKADMVFTDPPYGIAVKNTKGDILGDENLDVFEECMPNILLSVKERTHAYIFFGSKLAEQSLLILNKYFKQYNLLIMPITNQTQPYPEGYFSSNYEICYFTNINGVRTHNSGIVSVSETTKKDNRYNGDGYLKKYYALSEQPITEHNANNLHPTQKNVKGIDFFVLISSNENDLVLDLFLGSGSTMVAAHQLNRKCYGMELEPKYCQVIIDRMRKLDPTLVIKKNGVIYE